MQLHLQPSNVWKNKCEALGESWGLDLEKHEIRIYQNIGQAVYEAMLGLRRLYQHKKKIFFLKNQNPHIEYPLHCIAKDGLLLEPQSSDVFTKADPLLSAMDRETLFFVYSVDDPVLGLYEPIEDLEALLQGTANFRIRISYHKHLYEARPKPERNLVQIMGCPDGCAIALLGERTRFAPQGVELLDWSGFPQKDYLKILEAPKLNSQKILEFESRKDLGFVPLLEKTNLRSFDRAVVSWSDLDSCAMRESLLADPNSKPTWEKGLESLSLSRWGGVKGFEWLIARGYTRNQLRGAMIIDGQLLASDFDQSILRARQKILEAQQGDQRPN